MSCKPKRADTPPSVAISYTAISEVDHQRMRVFAKAALPTRFGKFQVVAFERADGSLLEHIALTRGALAGAERVPTRIHSECLTGDALGSLRCDCRDQLEMAFSELAKAPTGVLIYMRQEGRGIGLANKINAYAVQDEGLDTVEANRHLGFGDDLRDYTDSALILQCLGVRSVVVYTNNPAKVAALEKHGIEVTRRLPLHPEPNTHNRDYIQTKQKKMGHL